MNDSIIKVSLATFQSAYKTQNIQNIPHNISLKAQYFKDNFSCFNTYYDPKMIWEKKRFTKKDKQYTKPKNRFHIIIPDFTDNSMNKRQLIGLLNKLTDKNKNVIYDKVNNIIQSNHNEEFFLLIWSYIKKNDGELYLNILYLFDKTFLQKQIDSLWEDYVVNKGWLPPDYVFENNLLLFNDDYEMYCDYVKWKKETHNLNIIWIKLGKDVNKLLFAIYEYFFMYCSRETEHTNIHKYIIDIFLEQLGKILKVAPNAEIIDRFRQLNINDFESSSKFLIYDILEKNK